jgi:drug/metabolite transporter (DMT)-like permease
MLIGNGFANAAAFGMMFVCLALLGPARATVILTLEAVFTVILSTTVLHQPITAWQLFGAVGVLTAAVVVASKGDPKVVETEAAVAP